MTGLLKSEVYRKIKAINIGPTLSVIDKLEFSDSGGVCAWVTKSGSVMPDEMRQLIGELQLGGQVKRLFCRKLLPYQGIPPHVDDWMPDETEWRRFQVPLVSHPEIKMRWPDDGVELYLEPGFLYEVRFDRLHEVVNNAPVERIHIQIDTVDSTI